MSAEGVSVDQLQAHRAVRPLWLCGVCAAPWPCQPAKLALKLEYAGDPVALAIYLCTLMYDAAADFRRHQRVPCSPQELFNRFVSWTRC